MISLQDKQAAFLYAIARDPGDSLIDHDQRIAVESLGNLARSGNLMARDALAALIRLPRLHPLIREMVAAELGVPVP